MTDKQSIEQLQARYSEFRDQKIQVQAQKELAEKRLEELKAKAREAFGTDDVRELAKKLESIKTENEEKRKQYQQDLEKISAELTAVEEKYAESSQVE